MISIMKNYIDNMLNEYNQRKAFILDEETLGMVSIVYSRTVIL